MTDFLLELRCEEIPARMQAGARADLEKLLRQQLSDAGVQAGAITVWSTPRRLALIAFGLPAETEAVREETKGPRTSAPEHALEGFLRKTGLSKDQLEDRDGVWFALVEKPGRAVKDVLAEAIPAIVRAFPWPKSQRWGAASISTESLRWVRPLSGIVAIFGEELVTCEVGGVHAGFVTMGHRFHHPDAITIGGAADYQDKLRACHVIVDHEERQNLIREKAMAAASAAGLVLVEDEGLVIENAGLTEWPVPLLGRFDDEYLEVPPEVIQLTARTNQKYFICRSPLPPAGGAGGGPVTAPTPNPSRKREGDLANAFVCTANIAASDGGAGIVAGNRKVLAARLSDARFFWQQDRKKSLAEHAAGLERITFHEKLGTVADKVERVAKLARWLVEEGIVKSSPSLLGEGDRREAVVEGGGVYPPPSVPTELPPPRDKLGEDLASLAEQAARLCKADLVTEMVGEFPELQGLMGGYYARAEGLPDAVADAIRDHYKPVGQGDEVPTAPVTVAVSLADKLDTLMSFFGIDEKPTGSRDPFALRRAAIGVIALIVANEIKAPVWGLLTVTSIEIGGEIVAREMGRRSDEVVIALERRFGWRAHQLIDEIEVDEYDEGFSHDHWAMDSFDFARHELLGFLIDRLKVQQREAGVRHDLIDAVFALGGEDDLVRLLARVHALQAFITTPDGANLLGGYKRAANILKKEGFDTKPAHPERSRGIEGDGDGDGVSTSLDMSGGGEFDMSGEGLRYTPEPAEQALIDALGAAGPTAATAVAAEDFAGAMAALASLREPIDAFFENVIVNDSDAAKRAARLSLLAGFRDAVHRVADFSKIEG